MENMDASSSKSAFLSLRRHAKAQHTPRNTSRASCVAGPLEQSMCQWHEGQQGDADLSAESFIRSHCCADGMKQRLQQSAVCRQAARERLPRGRSPRRSPDTATVSTTESTRTLPESFLHSNLCSTTCVQKPCRELRIEANSPDAFEPHISSCISRRHLHRFAAEEQPAKHCTNAVSFGDAELQAQSCHSSLACGTDVAGTTTGTKGGSYRAC